jgi:hypothetical protein
MVSKTQRAWKGMKEQTERWLGVRLGQVS